MLWAPQSETASQTHLMACKLKMDVERRGVKETLHRLGTYCALDVVEFVR